MDVTIQQNCLNCGESLKGNFCHNCGQKDIPQRLTWGEVRSDLVGSIFGVQKGFWKTFIGLMKKPGETVRAYLSGHRKVYQSPIQYYLIATTILFIVYNYFGFVEHIADGTMNAQIAGQDKVDENTKKVFEKMAPLFNNMRLVVALMPPILALSYKWFFSKKTGFTYIEHLVFAVFTIAHGSFLSVPITPFVNDIGGIGMFIPALVSLVYITWCIKQMYKTNYFKAFMAYLVGNLVFFFFFTFAIIVPLMIYIIVNKGL